MATTEESENSKVKASSIDDTSTTAAENRNCKIKLVDLKVSDLKLELEKRDLDKNGIKSTLIERLRNYLLGGGENPDEFTFEVPYDSICTKNSLKKQVPDSETNGETSDTVVEATPIGIETTVSEIKALNLPYAAKESEDTSANVLDDEPCEVKEIKDAPDETEIEDILEEMVEAEDLPDETKKVEDTPNVKSEVEDTTDDLPNEKDTPDDLNKTEDTPDDLNKVDTKEEKDIPDKVNKGATKEAENSTEEIKDVGDLVEIEETENVPMQKICVTTEDKVNEIALQLTIDEEEAQLNEENVEGSKVDDVNINIKPANDGLENSCKTKVALGSSGKKDLDEAVPTKDIKSVTEAVKGKVMTAESRLETTNAVSPKMLKMIGKNDKMKNPNVLAKSLWISGLPSTTRAADLKTLFTKQGRVLSVKIVKSTKQTPAKCYGFVTMATSKDATKAIENLHRIELNGRTISVERTQSEPSALLKKSESRITTSKKPSVKKAVKTSIENVKPSTSEPKASKTQAKSTNTKSGKESSKPKDEKMKSSEKSKSKEKDRKSRDHKEKDERRPVVRRPPVRQSRPFTFNERPRSRALRRPYARRPMFNLRSDMSMPEKLRQDGIRQRARIRERERRDVERRRALEVTHHRYIERKQREEALRLEREKEKLRLEREILERERAEMLKIERERQRLERDRLEREREELRKQAALRRSLKRPFPRSTPRETTAVWDNRKKVPRFEERSSYPVEKLRLDVPSASRYDYLPRDRPSYSRPEYERHTDRYASLKPARTSPRLDYGDRDSRREITMRTREERQVYERNEFGDRDARRRFPSRDSDRRERSTSRRDSARGEWKQERRVHGRVASPSSSSAQRRMTYY